MSKENLKVYQAILGVMADLSDKGIGKNQTNTQQGWKFRGIDDVCNTLSPLLVKNKLLILPRVVNKECSVVSSKGGGNLNYVRVDVEYDFVSGEDGSCHIVKMSGEAMDSGDKATSKAESIAYKYACFQAFCIPLDGDSDPDAKTHEATPTPNVLEDRIMGGGMPEPDREEEKQVEEPVPTINEPVSPPITTVLKATPNQVKYLKGLLKDNKEHTEESICEAYGVGSLEDLEKIEASNLIGSLRVITN